MKYKDFLEDRLRKIVGDTIGLPSGFSLVGHVALVQTDSDNAEFLRALGKATLAYDKRIKSVAVRIGPTRGAERVPSYQLIAGNDSTATVYTEGGIRFKLDPLRITFSAGNKRERLLVKDQVRPGEVIVDMFACVGQFALRAAFSREDIRVTAIEINKDAFHYLTANITLNKLDGRVYPILGDCREKHPIGTADRIYMGYLHDTIEYLPHALQTLSSSGGFIHMHMAHPENETELVKEGIFLSCSELGFSADVQSRRVKWYSPGVVHKAYDIHVS
jgi:tRNA wybutosine-synthesizing protein 2